MKQPQWRVGVGLGVMITGGLIFPLAGARGSGPEGAAAPSQGVRDVNAMLAEISADRVKATVERLVSFGTRHTLSDTESQTRGIGAARRWIKAEFEDAFGEAGHTDQQKAPVAGIEAIGAAGADAAFAFLDSHRYEPDKRRIDVPVDVVNVVAVLPGSMPEARERIVYITGHYDSINGEMMNRTDDAPGANDDASGVAALMECARVMAKHKYDATIVFMATAGEEQGLLGAKLHAQAARAAKKNIVAVLNNDIVGDPAGQFMPWSKEAAAARKEIRLFSEGVPKQTSAVDLAQIALLGAESDSPSRELARFIADVAERQALAVRPRLIFRNDRFLRGGDHTAFLDAGFAAGVRFTAPNEDYTRQHATPKEKTILDEHGKQKTLRWGDLPEFVEAEYLCGVTRLNAAAAAHLANAPSTPGEARIITAKLDNQTTIRWSKCPESDVAGYEVVVRATTAPQWERVIDVGNTLEWTGDISKDDNLFGVRAYDRDGYRSVVGFARAGKE